MSKSYRNVRPETGTIFCSTPYPKHYNLQSKYILCVFTYAFVCLYPKNVKKAELIGSKFCVGPHMTLRKGYEC